MLHHKKAVIFDLDGSLVDSMWVWQEIDLEFLGARGIALPDDYQKEIEGMSFTETACYSIERFHLSETPRHYCICQQDFAEGTLL